MSQILEGNSSDLPLGEFLERGLLAECVSIIAVIDRVVRVEHQDFYPFLLSHAARARRILRNGAVDILQASGVNPNALAGHNLNRNPGVPPGKKEKETTTTSTSESQVGPARSDSFEKSP